MWIIWLLAAALVIGLALFAGLVYRVTEVRRAGTPVLLRRLPASADAGWRHGCVHYTDDAFVYYRLTALRPGPTDVLLRSGIEVTDRRGPEGTEGEIMEPDTVVLQLTADRAGTSHDYEIAMNPNLVTGFQSWLEASAPQRTRRRRPKSTN